MTHSGYTIVFGGPEFQPDEFLRDSHMKPAIVRRGDTLRSGRSAEESWLEFFDIHTGSYPLNAVIEALDFLQSRHDEFVRLAQFPGVVTRTLNFFGTADLMEFAPADIALLHELSIHVSICCSLEAESV